VRRLLTLIGLVLLVPPVVSAQAQQRATSLDLKFTIIQEATFRHPHPPEGDAGDSFSTTLVLINAAAQLGKPLGQRVGTMGFAYTLSGVCSGAGSGCKGTTDIQTFTKLPGGTITANSNKVPLGARPFVVKVLSGTGAFKGAQGSVEIAPSGDAKTSYILTLP
jgi:hypothetical protein